MAFKPFSVNHDLASADVNDLVGVYDRSTGTVTVGNTVTETSLYSKSIGANHLSTDRELHLRLSGTNLINTGGGGVMTFRVKFGATTVIADGVTFLDDADTRSWQINVWLSNLGATNSQWIQAQGIWHPSPIAPATTGTGTLEVISLTAGSGETGGYVTGTSAEDTTAAKTLDVTVQHSGASANLTISKKYGLLLLS